MTVTGGRDYHHNRSYYAVIYTSNDSSAGVFRLCDHQVSVACLRVQLWNHYGCHSVLSRLSKSKCWVTIRGNE